MANAYKENRFIIDTAGTTLLRGTLASGESSILLIKGIRWVSKTASAGDQAIIQDADGIVYWESVASGSNYVESDLLERKWQKDFKVTTLTTGTLYIYLYAGRMI